MKRKTELKNNNLYVDGRPVLLCGADIPYFRLDCGKWERVLSQAKKEGVNLISTYIPWYFHEEEEGKIDLEGRTSPAKDLHRFLETACQLDLFICARPGPFINSELRWGGFPRWLFEKYPETLSHTASGKPCTGRPCPAEGEPLYREKVRNWYQAVVPVIAEFQDQDHGGVILFQPDNELSAAWSFGLLNSLYDPEILQTWWPSYLEDQYQEIGQLNSFYGTSYTSFQKVHPPARFPASASEKKKAVDWMNFKRSFFADWGMELAKMARELGIHVPITLNEPVAGFFNHGDHSGVGARLRRAGFPIFTSCHTYSDRLQDWDGCADAIMAVRLNRSSPLNTAAVSVEAGAGCYNERLRKSDLNWSMLLRNNLMDGLAGNIIYSYVNGAAPLKDTIEGPQYWPGAPLSAEGSPHTLTGTIRDFYRFVQGWNDELSTASCPEEVNLGFSAGIRLSDFLGTYPLRPSQSETTARPGGESFCAEPKIDRGEVSFSHDWLDGYEGVSKQTVALETGGWRKVREALVLLVRMGFGGRMVDLADPCLPPQDHTPLIFPNAGCLEEKAFTYLKDYLKEGGTAILTPMIPQYDLFGEPNRLLMDLLGAQISEMIRPAGGEVLDYGARIVRTVYQQQLSIHSWMVSYRFSRPAQPLAFYGDLPVAWKVNAGRGQAVVVGFEAIFQNGESVRFWQDLLQKECGVSPRASEDTGSFSLFSRSGPTMQFLAAGNAAGSFDPGMVHFEGYTFPVELLPHEGRILVFHAPVAGGRNKICYTSSEVVPLDPERKQLELHGAAGTCGKTVFAGPADIRLNGVRQALKKEKDGYALLYEHTRNPLLLQIDT